MLVYELETDGTLIHWSSARTSHWCWQHPPLEIWCWWRSPLGIWCWQHPVLGFWCWWLSLLGSWCWWHPCLHAYVNDTQPRESDFDQTHHGESVVYDTDVDDTHLWESDIDDTPSGEYDVNKTHPYERIWCWWHPPEGICFWWHPPWESDVDDTHTGESDVENNALPPPRESDVDDASHHKIRHWKNFLMDGVRSRLSWIKSMTFFSHSSLQRTFDISAKSSRSNQRENIANVIFWSGFSVHILPRKYARWTQLAFSELCLLATSCHSTKIESDRTKSKSINQQVKQNK